MLNISCVAKLCEQLNNANICKGTLNGCVINFYPKGTMQSMPHADNESYVDQTVSVCSLSIGHTRMFNIHTWKDLQNPEVSFKLEHSSLMLMHPPSQFITKHHLVQTPEFDGARWSISFRGFIPAPPNPSQWPYYQKKGTPPIPTTPVKPYQLPSYDMSNITAERFSPAITHTVSSPTLRQVTDLVASASLESCKHIMVAVTNRLKELEILESQATINPEDAESLVTYIPSFLDTPRDHLNISTSMTADTSTSDHSQDQNWDPERLIFGVKEELETLGLNEDNINPDSGKQSDDGVVTTWLLNDPTLTPFLKGRNLDEFRNLVNLQKVINDHDQCVGETNACLVAYYRDGNSGTRIHSDNQGYVCNETSICNFSVGIPRKITFFSGNSHSSPAVKSVEMENSSLLIMQPKCQQKLKHVVVQSPTTEGRYCLSFRRVLPLTGNLRSSNSEPPKKAVTVILGTSITTKIRGNKLVGKHPDVEVINSSTSGAKLEDISNKIDQMYAGTLPEIQNHSDKANLNIRNIIFSFGTNDVRFKRNGVHNLYLPIRALLIKARNFFPGAKIFVQSCIPIKLENPWTATNVMDFNDLQKRCCGEVPECYYMDIFESFLERHPRKYPLRKFYSDNVHPSYEGRSIIARAYIKIVRGYKFDVKF